jgi:hypothetical protein
VLRAATEHRSRPVRVPLLAILRRLFHHLLFNC